MKKDLTVYIPKRYREDIMERFDYNTRSLLIPEHTDELLWQIRAVCPLCVKYISKNYCPDCPFEEWGNRVYACRKGVKHYCVKWMYNVLHEKFYFKPMIIKVVWRFEDHDKAIEQLDRLKEAIEKYIVFTD